VLAIQTIEVKETMVRSPEAAMELIPRELREADREVFVVLHLRSNLKSRFLQIAAIGSSQMVTFDVKDIFCEAITRRSSVLVVMHLHPDEDERPEPTAEDIAITKDLVEAGRILAIPVVDHIIFTDRSFYSFMKNDLVFDNFPIYLAGRDSMPKAGKRAERRREVLDGLRKTVSIR